MRSLQDHFLIAMPAMEDPNFNATVTYLCKHDAAGALGVVINRPATRRSASSWPARHQAARPGSGGAPVLRGGPVEHERGFVLHRSTRPFDVTFDAGRRHPRHRFERHFGRVARGEVRSPTSWRSATRGGAAASSKRSCLPNAWLTVEADPAVVFETPFEQRWTGAVGLLGVDAHQITSYAGHA